MQSGPKLSESPPRPRTGRSAPGYPRQTFMLGAALSLAACMGAAPSPYGPTTPAVQVTHDAGDPRFAQPPPDDVATDPTPVEPVDPVDPVQPPGEAPLPYP
jgi:hypothetical protein